MENVEIQRLLKQAANEIKSLRQQNQLMSARLEVYDTMKLMLNTEPNYPRSGAMHPDIVYELEKANDLLESTR